MWFDILGSNRSLQNEQAAPFVVSMKCVALFVFIREKSTIQKGFTGQYFGRPSSYPAGRDIFGCLIMKRVIFTLEQSVDDQ